MLKLLPLLTVILTAATCTFGQSVVTNVSTGTLKLWLRADAGVVTNPSGRVGQWLDQSPSLNHASQATLNSQPLFVANALNGKPVLRFDGVQDGLTGDHLQGTGNVGIPTAFTSFLVYSHRTNVSEQVPVLIGTPGSYDETREYYIPDGQMAFSAWGNDYHSGFSIPTNQYRIWEFRMNTNKSELEFFDRTASGSFTNATGTGGIGTPSAGYYIGGLGSETRNLKGDIAELIVYAGRLSETDRLAVEDYLFQKYLLPAPLPPTISQHPVSRTLPTGTNATFIVTAAGSGPLSYQWNKDGSPLDNGGNISGATTSTLILSNLTTAHSGLYNVTVSNAVNSVSSSNATLNVLTPITILTNPQSQSVIAGTNVDFNVWTAGDAPKYQWKFKGNALPGATGSSLMLTNVSASNAGIYSVLVTNEVSAVVSSEATLSIVTPPIIHVQPTDVTTLVGSTATFSVGVGGDLPQVNSGNLRLWLKADTGVVKANGLVSQWIDQSGFNNSCFQSDSNKQPSFVTNALNGNAALRFDGLQNSTLGDFLQGTNQVGISNAFTSFIFYKRDESNSGTEKVPVLIGAPGQNGATREYYIPGNQMAFSAWANDYSSGFTIPTNIYRIWSFRMNQPRTLLEFFDTDGSSNFTTSRVTSISGIPAPGYYVGGLGSQTRNLKGDIAEIIVYQGALTNSDRTAVENYLKGKYFFGASETATANNYQWFFEGVAITGATNASLTITNVQVANAGSYYVTVSNVLGSVTSSNALLTVNVPPYITAQPENLSRNAGTSGTLSVTAQGTPLLNYAWQKNGFSVLNATNATLTFNAIQPSDAGNYRVVVSNPYGSITSTVVSVTVNVSTLRVVSTNAAAASTFMLPIELDALGNENATGFSLAYDPAVLTYESASVGNDAGSAVLIANTNGTANGKIGIALALPTGNTFVSGKRQIAKIMFRVAARTNSVNTSITMGDVPTLRQISDASATNLTATFLGGTVAITPSDLEGDVSPRPNGNYTISVTDWVQVGRFVAGLDSFINASEFQRADCAPKNNRGNGSISITDWVQAGRYATGNDPLTAAGGPTSPNGAKSAFNSVQGTRTIQLTPSVSIEANAVVVKLNAEGNENAVGFSLTFDPAVLTFKAVAVVGVASTAILNLNTNEAGNGKIGIALALPTGSTFGVGVNQILQVSFASGMSETTNTTVNFGNSPVVRETSDAAANSLSTTYIASSFVINPPPLTIVQTEGLALLSWPVSPGNFVLETSVSLSNSWSTVTNNLTTNGSIIEVGVPTGGEPKFYRLKSQ